MPRSRKPARHSSAEENHSTIRSHTESAVIKEASILAALAETAPPNIDFQARQDAVGEKRKGPGEKLSVKIRTRAKPADAPETEI